jgi:undecaprenyl-diphosphatase
VSVRSDPEATPGWLGEIQRLDEAVYVTVARTPTPRLDGAMRRLTNAANYSRLSMASAAVLAVTGGQRGRRAAASGLATVALTSGVVNLLVKPAARRRRPVRDTGEERTRNVRMPTSGSFPSGHTAAAFAFANAAGRVMPLSSVPLHTLAAVVGYSRVHTGVHYPGDVIAGAVIGAVIADLSGDTVDGAVNCTSTRSRSRSS